jgi:choline kinase
MTALIIAAGRGERLDHITSGKPKTLLPVNGKPILQRILDDTSEAGFQQFIIVTGYENEKIEEYIDSRNEQYKIQMIKNKRWEGGNGISVLEAKPFLDHESMFLLLMSDHLIDSSVIKAMVKSTMNCPLLAVERNIEKVFDIEDATKVLIENNQVISIGKEIKHYNSVDIGVFLFDRNIFDCIERAIRDGDDSLTGGVKNLIKLKGLHAYSIPESIDWIDIDSEASYMYAQKMWRR